MPEIVSPSERDVPVDYARLAEYLAALAYPVRLALLDVLRFPHALAEIRVGAERVEPGANAGRPAAKQTVAAHLDKLVDVGLVQVREAERAGRLVPTYVVNPQRMYAVTEEMRRLLVMYAGKGIGDDLTGTVAAAAPEPAPALGPRLVLVHGVYDGKTFALSEQRSIEGAWTIGRRRDVAVSLDYDPYVSVENSDIVRDGGAFVLVDRPESKNGTTLNWDALPRGGRHRLRRGDIIGVGRSRLLFLDD